MVKKKVSLKFSEVNEHPEAGTKYTTTCSGSRSDCCTRVCTRPAIGSDDGSLDSWDEYLEANAGVLQY
ncbi:hypothetical protein DQ397_003177 [Pseudomonas sp. CK-NBRI-02]|nr:hypothetical protein DQ397_003177 [Pseudomonas sp. CK-NBRI-02]